MTKAATSSVFVFVLRILVGCLFLASGILKLADPQSFADVLRGFDLLPNTAIQAIAFALPLLEAVSGFLLISGFWVKYVAGIIMGLLLLFIAATIPALAAGKEITCGCFGPLAAGRVDGMLVARDAFLVALSFIIIYQNEHRFTLPGLVRKVRNPGARYG